MSLFRRIVVYLCASIGAIVLAASFTPFVSWYGGKLAGPWNDPDGDILIVLGGGEAAEGFPNDSSLWRCIYAQRAWKEGHFRKVVISGAGVSAPMREFLVWKGVPPDAVVVEDGSHSTRENAVLTARLLAGESGKKVLLTSDYHMFRATRAFRKAGVEIQPRPFPDARKRATRLLGRWPAFLDEAVETCKIGYYRARGWI